MALIQVLVAGESSTGKSQSLINLSKNNPKSVAYLSAEAGKSTPFKNNFTTLISGIKSPHEAIQFFQQVEQMDSIEYCVMDGFNYLMDMFESQQKNGYDGWKDYAEFIKDFMQQIVGTSKKKWIVIAHNFKELMDQGLYRYYVPIKGSASKIGLESYFNVVVYTVKLPIKKAHQLIQENKVDPELFFITEDEEIEGVKYCFQVRSTADMAEGRIRSLAGMWNAKQIYINNDAQLLMNHLTAYYAD